MTDAVDLCAGPGGWDLAATELGLDVVGLELDEDACATAQAAGHRRIRADIATYPLDEFRGVPGLIASPPCQAWSSAGKQLGEQDRTACHTLADRMAGGDDSTDWHPWADPRSPLVCQPIRWARELRPEWVALEEVPAVLGLWEHFARILNRWGYSTWSGVLNAADYGVPQTRRRAFLIARRGRPVLPPAPTHAEDGGDLDLFGDGRLPWVSMAEALGWSSGDVVRPARGAGMIERHGDRPDHPASGPAPTVISKARSWTRFVASGVTGAGRPKDPATCPADTITGKGTAYWTLDNGQNPARTRPRGLDEPAPTVFCSRPGNLAWRLGDTATRVTVEEAGVLQSFPFDYPWQGSRSKQYLQVGNAVPPRLARAVLAAVVTP